MRFKAERAQFADAVLWAQRTVGDRATLPAVAGIRLVLAGDRLVLSSTNLESESELTIPVQAEREGTALVLGKLLADVVRSLPPAPVTADVQGDVLHLTCERARFALRLIPAEDFPALRQATAGGATAVLKADDFARTVAQVARAAGTDDARPVLTGVHMEATSDRLAVAATDSYRLAVRTVDWDQDAHGSAVVPKRALEQARHSAELLGGEVRMVLEAGQVTFAFGDRRLSSRLIEGTFPDYRQLLPTDVQRRLEIDRAELVEVVKRVAVVGEADPVSSPVTLDLSADTVRVSAGSGEVGRGEESLPARLEGDELQIAFNPRYLTDGLEVAGGERVLMEFRDELQPAVIRPPSGDASAERGGEFVYLLMPVRL